MKLPSPPENVEQPAVSWWREKKEKRKKKKCFEFPCSRTLNSRGYYYPISLW